MFDRKSHVGLREESKKKKNISVISSFDFCPFGKVERSGLSRPSSWAADFFILSPENIFKIPPRLLNSIR